VSRVRTVRLRCVPRKKAFLDYERAIQNRSKPSNI
jgi:hypothetical protein